MKTWYVVRFGWNSANQSSVCTIRNPKTDFESGRAKLVAIVEAATSEEAKARYKGTVYPNQYLDAYSSFQSLKGLKAEVRAFLSRGDDLWEE